MKIWIKFLICTHEQNYGSGKHFLYGIKKKTSGPGKQTHLIYTQSAREYTKLSYTRENIQILENLNPYEVMHTYGYYGISGIYYAKNNIIIC